MSNASSTAKDLTAGTVGGIAQVLVGQPFDIVKVVRLIYLSISFSLSSLLVLSFFFVLSFFRSSSFPPSLLHS